MKNSTALIIAACIFSVVSFMLYAILPSSHQDIDSKAYVYHAQQFVKHGHFTGAEQPYFALGYAFFLGCLFKLFGDATIVIVFIQLLLALLSCWLIMRITHTVFGPSAACAAALLFACSVGYLVFVQFILTEVLLSFFLLLFVERFFAGSLWAAGVALGLSVCVKPAALLFVFPVVGVMVMRHVRNGSRVPSFHLRPGGFGGQTLGPQDDKTTHVLGTCKSVKQKINYYSILSSWGRLSAEPGIHYIVIFILCFYFPIVGYMTHNKIIFNSFSISRLGTVNMYDWFLPNVLATQNDTTSDFERHALNEKYHHDDDFTARAGVLRTLVRKNPLLVARVWALNMFKTATGLYMSNFKVLACPARVGANNSFFSTRGTLVARVWAYITIGTDNAWIIAVGIFETLFSILRYVLCALGLYVLYRRKEWTAGAFFVLYLAYFFGITGHDGCARFRMMSEGILIVLAAGGMSAIARSYGETGKCCIKREKKSE